MLLFSLDKLGASSLGYGYVSERFPIPAGEIGEDLLESYSIVFAG